MKIIKEGKIPNKKAILKCQECGTVFEADNGEYTKTKVVNLGSYTGYRDKYESVCPICEHKGEMTEIRYEELWRYENGA